MIYTNQFLTDFIGNNWMALLILYGIFRAMFPASKILAAIGGTFANIFPVLRNNGSDAAKKEATPHG
jgi:phage-related minor tail protein